MPSPITSSQFENQTPGQPLCDAFQEKLLNNSKMRSLLDYFFKDPSGVLNVGFIGDLLSFVTPIGSTIWVPKTLLDPTPANGAQWLEANNQRLLQADYARLYALYGLTYNQAGDNAATEFRVPDLQGKFLLGRSSSHAFGTSGGEEEHRLSGTEFVGPDHTHAVGRFVTDSGGPADSASFITGANSPEPTGDARRCRGASSGALTDTIEDLTGAYIKTARANGYIDSDTSDDFDDSITPHNNMPPYFTGVIYVLAGYKVDGTAV